MEIDLDNYTTTHLTWPLPEDHTLRLARKGVELQDGETVEATLGGVTQVMRYSERASDAGRIGLVPA